MQNTKKINIKQSEYKAIQYKSNGMKIRTTQYIHTYIQTAISRCARYYGWMRAQIVYKAQIYTTKIRIASNVQQNKQKQLSLHQTERLCKQVNEIFARTSFKQIEEYFGALQFTIRPTAYSQQENSCCHRKSNDKQMLFYRT